MLESRPIRPASVLLPLVLAAAARSQTYVPAPAQMPLNTGETENCDFGDLDGDGDRDCVLAEGGDSGNDQNNLWVNRGFEPGGTIGFFADRTAAQFPAVLDTSRDVDLVDFDLDGDLDLQISNTATWVNQSNRWWVNMGGAQGGTEGFFQDQTQARWAFVGVNDGVNHFSSVAPTMVLASGGYVDWSCDSVLGDLDADGDPDLVQSSYGGSFQGGVPTRLFLNDGQGSFEEFNPSGFQLTGANIFNGNPALWAQGTHQHDTTNTTGTQADVAQDPLGVELGDLDGDLDLDVLLGARGKMPRAFRSRLTDVGSFAAFRDATYASGYPTYVLGAGHYEQEVGDLDSDDDLDILGVNWSSNFVDVTLRNDGAGVFGSPFNLTNSNPDDNDADFLDYDADGDLDLYVVGYGAQDRLYRNDGAPGWNFTNVTASELPTLMAIGLGGDSCDIDLDGDYEYLVTNGAFAAEVLLKNVSQVPDTTAPRVARLEQAPDRAAGPLPTRVRVHVYDNSSWDVARYDAVGLEYSWNGGLEWHSAPMSFSGGQLFRGEIRGDLAGTIQYRVRAADEHGNVGLSGVKSFNASGCTGNVFTYCTPGTTSSGCTATMSASGVPSVSAPSGFVLSAGGVDGQRAGLIFYGTGGKHVVPWGTGTSFACIKSPTQRTAVGNSGGTAGACDGSLSLDWLAYLASNPGALGAPFSAGQTVNSQCWFRDPPAPKSTSLSNGLEFTTCP